jgi:5-methylcytosine-specific restriction endonuclease McrA
MPTPYSPEFRAAALQLFHGRCVLCFAAAAHVHHIEPRSLAPNKQMDLDNVVALCPACHEEVHTLGTQSQAPRLRTARARALEILGEP